MFLFKQNLNKYNHLQNLKYLSLTDEKKILVLQITLSILS